MKKISQWILFGLLSLTVSWGIIGSVKAWSGKLEPYQQVSEEFRAVWVATVYNMNIEKQMGTDAAAIEKWKNNYLSILDNAQKYRLNAIVFQVRPANDAFYPSKYNPWSEFMAGYGVNPGWDPLEWMIQATHERGIEFHAWLNPYRASVSASGILITQTDAVTNAKKVIDVDQQALNTYKKDYFANLKQQGGQNDIGGAIDNPIFASGDQLNHNVVVGTEGKFVLNPAADETIEHLENTVEEIVQNYMVDGIHFDDYFYPDDATYGGSNPNYKGHTFSTEPNVDWNDYQEYVVGGGDLSIYHWRRENVNRLISSLSTLIRKMNGSRSVKCAFGISPAARWAPSIEACGAASPRGAEGGMNGSCNDYYSYSDLYADTKKWVEEEWLDYLCPQVYTNLDSSYGSIVNWWDGIISKTNVKFYIGTAVYQVPEWGDLLEMYNQIRYNQSNQYHVDGYVLFSYNDLVNGKGSIAMDTVVKALWKNPTLSPLYAAYEYETTLTDTAKVTKIKNVKEAEYQIDYTPIDGAKAYMIYRYLPGDQDIFQNKNLVTVALKGTSSMHVKYDAAYQYCLVTINGKNERFGAPVEIDLANAPKNVPPVISEISKIDEKVLYHTKINVTAKVTDADGDTLSYIVRFAEDGINYQVEIAKGTIVDGKVAFAWEAYGVDLTGAKFEIEVTDGTNTVSGYTNSFDVVEKLQDPTPPQPTPNPQPSKCSCKKQSGLLYSLFSAGTLLLIIIKKRGKNA